MTLFTTFVVSLFLLLSTIPTYSAVFNVSSGDVIGLIDAINAANANGKENTINLAPGTYTLTAIDNGVSDFDSNGLPVVTGIITINGENALSTTLERSPDAPIFRIFSIASSGKLTINGITVRRGGGSRTRFAGGFSNAGSLTINRSIIEDFDCCEFEEALAIRNTGTLKLSHTVVTNNRGFHAAAIFNLGTMTIVSSSFTFNKADAASAIDNRGTGMIQTSTISGNQSGHGPIGNRDTLTIINSTIADNLPCCGQGGAISNSGILNLINSTVSGNAGGTVASTGGISNLSGSVQLQNTILAGNTAPFFAEDCRGLITSLGNNIIGVSGGECDIDLLPSDLTGNPGLGDFVDDDEPGHGHFPLLESSPAIDAGNNDVCLSNPLLATDQIGDPRVGVCDIGAIEFGSVPLLTVALDVRPGSAENSVNPRSNGVIPVAILSTDNFDASTVDEASLRLGPGQALSEGGGQLSDVNGDGLTDLVLRFRTQQTSIQCGDTSVSITGQTFDGIPIKGSDSITTVGCNR